MLLLSLFPGGVFEIQVAGWKVARSVETTAGRAVAVPVGAVLGVLAFHILNAFAGANASIASALLGPDGADGVERVGGTA